MSTWLDVQRRISDHFAIHCWRRADWLQDQTSRRHKRWRLCFEYSEIRCALYEALCSATFSHKNCLRPSCKSDFLIRSSLDVLQVHSSHFETRKSSLMGFLLPFRSFSLMQCLYLRRSQYPGLLQSSVLDSDSPENPLGSTISTASDFR